METKPSILPVASPGNRHPWLWLLLLAICIAAGVFWMANTGHTRAQSTQQSGQRRSIGQQVVPVAAAKAVVGDAPVFLDGSDPYRRSTRLRYVRVWTAN